MCPKGKRIPAWLSLVAFSLVTPALAQSLCEWSAVGGSGGRVESFAVFDDGSGPALYAVGVFTSIGGVPAMHIAKWDGSAWSALGAGVGTSAKFDHAHALAVFDDGTGPALYAGGQFKTAGSVTARGVAKWDGTSWATVGAKLTYGEFDPDVYALAVFDDGTGPALFVGGLFATAGGVPARDIAKWDGSSWSSVGGGTVGVGVEALTVFDDGTGPALFVGGTFNRAGNVTTWNIAKWDGTSWSTLRGGMNRGSWVLALAVFDDGTGPALYAGGSFSGAGGFPAQNIAKWDGSYFSPVGGGMNAMVKVLTVFDDGSGPALYAGGFFTTAGSTSANRIARWDGTSWSRLDTGLDPRVDALAAFDDGSGPALYAGGAFEVAGGVQAYGIARWRCTICYPNCDQSSGAGVLDIFDFLCWQGHFVIGNSYACDCDTSTGPGVCDVFDFLCFQDAFVSGCP